MLKTSFLVLAKSVALTAVAVLIAVVTNAVRADGIPLITDIPYEIFSACKDAEAESAEVSDTSALKNSHDTLFVDVRPKAQFDAERVAGAVNLPYSALFGASPEDVEKVKKSAAAGEKKSVVVYGIFRELDSEALEVDLAKPAAEQLVESGIANVRHIEGGLAAMKKLGVETVKGGKQ